MIAIQKESLGDVRAEIAPLLEMHYQELTCHKEAIKLAPMWGQYEAIEKAGKLAVFTARESGDLVGYAAFFVAPHLHYADTLCATNDVLFLHPLYRRGATGIRLIRYCEDELKKAGVGKLTWHIKHSLDWSPILMRMGYASEEVMVGKIL